MASAPAPLPRPKRARRGSGGLTLGDVARLAGVSPITVSRALNDPGRVSPGMLSRVQDAVARTRLRAQPRGRRARLEPQPPGGRHHPEPREPDVPGHAPGAVGIPRGRGLPGDDRRRQRLRRHARGRPPRRDHRPAPGRHRADGGDALDPTRGDACSPRAFRWSRPGTSRPRRSTCWWASPTSRGRGVARLPGSSGRRRRRWSRPTTTARDGGGRASRGGTTVRTARGHRRSTCTRPPPSTGDAARWPTCSIAIPTSTRSTAVRICSPWARS